MNTSRRTAAPLWLWLALAAVSLLALGNSWRYGMQLANPLVHADSWYFVEAFVQPWAEGELGWQDFFKKRGGDDHAQPLHRLSLWVNLHWAHLDFRLEAAFGLLGLAACLGLLYLLVARHLRALDAPASPLAIAAPLLLLPAMALSLNAHELYYWSLVAFFHVSLLPALLLFAQVIWRLRPQAATPGLPALLGTAMLSLLTQVALDGAGLLAIGALLPMLAWAGWRLGLARRALQFAAAALIGLLLYRALYAGLMPPVAPSRSGGLDVALGYLAAHAGEAWQWLLLPASASLVHPAHLPFWIDPAWTRSAQFTLGGLMLGAHGLFWWSLLRERRPAPLSLFAACLLLLSYALLAGILLSRVPVFGTGYLLQGRYVVFYQLANLALLLQLLVVLARRPRLGWRGTAGLLVLLLAGVGLQVLLSERAWDQERYVRPYKRHMASSLVCLGEHPQLAAPVCQQGNVVCDLPPARRDALLQLLREHQLNLYAPGFLDRHGLDEGLDTSVCLGEAARAAPERG